MQIIYSIQSAGGSIRPVKARFRRGFFLRFPLLFAQAGNRSNDARSALSPKEKHHVHHGRTLETAGYGELKKKLQQRYKTFLDIV
ncbi:MAG TPA: hypothetical protein DDW95_01515 [Alphaproteobacteria bacterium]|nr:hypothetical protein [Alphaproteobacteria bacterium]HAM46659.1 hypothetical protein [Alphaproteobacteria bacterium]HBA44354.1 hypothetical protein [Alphaproteobacteria bacterium]HBC54980.1 hypothetical protein [Alphaproteobacteria bacterium]HBF97204.1 hypothetical protein [Alphaproteobacteria bacterium]